MRKKCARTDNNLSRRTLYLPLGLTDRRPEGNIISMTVEMTSAVLRSAGIFRALADPTRLAIFTFIRACGAKVEINPDSGDVCCVSDTCVGDICCRFDIAPSTVSHHLRELREAGLILMERRGKWVYVAVNEEAIAELRAFLDELPQCGASVQTGPPSCTGAQK